MNLEETLATLESLGDEKRRALNVKNGAGKAKQFGVAMGDLRALAKKIKAPPETQWTPIWINEMVRRQR